MLESASATTVAPAVVVPLTVAFPLANAGGATVSGSDPGMPRFTYRRVTIPGVSRSRPVLMASASRAYSDCAQVRGLAEPAGLPGSKPIEAVVGSDPNGDASTCGSSQACSGSSPWPLVMLPIAVRNVVASARLPAATSYSPRSPPRTGQRWPEPVSVVGHGWP